MASMVPYRSVFGVRPVVPASLFDAFDDMMDIASSPLASKTFPIDVEDKGDAYEVKAYLTGVSKDDIDVELNEAASPFPSTLRRRKRIRIRTSCRRSLRPIPPRAACI